LRHHKAPTQPLAMDINKSKIVEYAESGNGLAATTDLEAGDVIIEIASPYIVVVERAALDKFCSQCLLMASENTPLKKCGRCKVARYCSTACQKEAWNTMHRLECSALAKLPDIPPTPLRALSKNFALGWRASLTSICSIFCLLQGNPQCKLFSPILLVAHQTLDGEISKPIRSTCQRQKDSLISCWKQEHPANMRSLDPLMLWSLHSALSVVSVVPISVYHCFSRSYRCLLTHSVQQRWAMIPLEYVSSQ
jgi:hypothetical protein